MQQNAQQTADKPLAAIMAELGEAARASARVLANMDAATRNAALKAAAAALRRSVNAIIAANARDLASAEQQGRPSAAIDRLRLDEKRIEAIAGALADIAGLPDPVGAVIAQWTRPNGLDISRVRTPIGVIGIIFESRPNVTADAGALCLKSGNAAILRPGSDSVHSSQAIHACLAEGLRDAGLPEAAIQLVPTTDRDAVGHMLAGLGGNVDVIVPRGGKSLVERVQADARVPVFAHLEGICHVYVDKAADLDMAKDVVVNAKMRRPGICGAAETLLVDRASLPDHLPALIAALIEAGCEVRGDAPAQAADCRVKPASKADWSTDISTRSFP